MSDLGRKLTAEALRNMLDYDPDSGVLTWRGRLGKQAGWFGKKGYLYIDITGRKYRAHRLCWLHFYGSWPELQLDHINGNRADNRIVNLREATPQQNSFNLKAHKDSKSGLKGVSWDSTRNKWRPSIFVSGKSIYLGRFNTMDEAKDAYARAAQKFHGEFMR